MEEEDVEICRVCRSEATPEQPLFHPCKCAGSIRYVHQDCLIEWLAHSRKKYCELCEHPFTFTPVYRQDMPKVIPTKLFIQQLRKKLTYGITTTLRAILVSCIWLILLPYFTIWVWRFYFFLGNNLSIHLSLLQQMKYHIGLAANTTILSTDANNSIATNWVQDYKSGLTLQTFLADCFEGQIITCVVVVIFVAVFLLREWIVQNIPMDAPVADEGEEAIEQVNPFPPPLPEEQPQNQHLDTLFDHNNWNHQQPLELDEQAPPSPIAPESDIWEDSVFSNNHINRQPRATSMPPSLSTSSSFHDDINDTQNSLFADEYRRSASMEPFINTGSPSSRFNATEIHHGHPPHAPRMRHAEAPLPIRPIPEEEEGEEEEQEEPVPINLEQPIVANQQQPVVEEDDDDDDDENLEEFEGVLEAIGMQGSLWSLAQNCALMGLLIALSLGAAVWMPYLIGMLFIMTEILDLVRIPLKLARMITDPVVDFVFLVCTEYLGPALADIYHTHFQSYWVSLSSMAIFEKLSTAIVYIFDYIMDNGFLLADTSNTHSSILTDTIPSESNTTIIMSVAKFINDTEPILESAFKRYQSLATGQTAMDRFACIAVGYIIITIFSCWYLSRSTNNNHTSTLGHTAQEAIRHQGIIFKVGMFITIELVLFPIVCGFLLDASTMPLFKSADLMSRIGYLRSHPVPSIFLHWFLGTGFMFLFAVLVTLCRDIVRPGVMWFIRDPNDPQFHPIREIVERPIFFQFKKIGASALIYLFVILVGVGGVVHFLKAVASDILPLRWSLSNPLSVVPVDLIAIQVGIPAIVKYFKPKETMKRLFVQCITFTCHQLRLSSFMFGGRRPDEEGTLVYHSWSAFFKRAKPSHYPAEGSIEDVIGSQVSYFWDGQLLRVPRHDSVPIIERRRMLVPVDNVTLQPIDERERQLGHPASSALGGEEVNTVIVYSPPHFKQRILLFGCFIWVSTSLFFCTITVLPVLLGRWIFKDIAGLENEVHDVYSFVLGGSIMLLIGTVVCQCLKSLRDVCTQSTWTNTLQTAWDQAKQWSSWISRWLFFVTSFGFIVPLSFGALVELYFVLPLRQLGQEPPSVEVLSLWAHGFACMVTMHGYIQIVPGNSIKQVLDNIFAQGINNMKVKLCITRILGPLLLITTMAICLPFLTAFINMKIVARTSPELRVKLVQIAYPIALVGLGAYYLGKVGSRIGSRLVENIREDNYLIGRTLHNLEE